MVATATATATAVAAVAVVVVVVVVCVGENVLSDDAWIAGAPAGVALESVSCIKLIGLPIVILRVLLLLPVIRAGPLTWAQ